MNRKSVSFLGVFLLVAAVSFAQPSGPFTPDVDTYLLMHLDGSVTDDSGNGVWCAFSDTPSPDPNFVASQSGFGQCLENPGTAAVEAIFCASEISSITDTFTYEFWINIPSVASAPENHNPGLFDRGAGRCLWRLWIQPSGEAVSHYITIYTGTTSDVEQYAWAVMDATAGWSYGDWHHMACTFDTSKTGLYGATDEYPPAQIFIDGKRLVTYAGAPAGAENGPRLPMNILGAPYYGEIFGRPWPPTDDAGGVLNWMVGMYDEARISFMDRYPDTAVNDWMSY